jgi:ribonuclease HI
MPTDPALHELVTDLHAHLEATEELDVNHKANRWIGEAEVVAEDITDDVSEQVIEKRVVQIEELLRNIDETENQEADEHIDAALSFAERIEERL